MKVDNSIKTNNENLINTENDNLLDSELTDDEKIDIVAVRVLKRFKSAFEELAKGWVHIKSSLPAIASSELSIIII